MKTTHISLFILLAVCLFFFGCNKNDNIKENEYTPKYEIDEKALFKCGLVAIAKSSPDSESDLIWGYMNEEGRAVVDYKFDAAYEFTTDGLARVGIEENDEMKYGYIGTSGEVVIDIIYEEAEDFSRGIAKVKLGGKWKRIDTEGNEVNGELADTDDSESQYGDSEENHIFIFQRDNKCGLMDRAGNIVLDAVYYQIYEYELKDEIKRYELMLDDKCGLADENGKIIAEPIYEDMRVYGDNGTMAVKQDGKWFFTDYNCVKVDDKLYDDVRSYCNGFAAVKIGEKWGFIDESGEYYVKPIFSEVFSFTDEGIARVRDGRKWGFIDNKGCFLLMPYYHSAEDFVNGLAAVSMNGKYGFIDKRGVFVVPVKYDLVNNFNEYGFATVAVSENLLIPHGSCDVGLVNSEGRELIAPEMDSVRVYSDGYITVSKDGYVGILNWEGKTIVPRKYKGIREYSQYVY